MDTTFLYAAIAIMGIIILRDVLKKRYGFDMDNVDISKYKNKVKPQVNNNTTSNANLGQKKLILIDAGQNKATVMATLRQITGIDYQTAKQTVEHVPSEILSNVTEKQATITKQALEFVGAKLEIR